jgi:hypothetical protein
MIQVDFSVDSVQEALSVSPTEVAYAEHAGGTRTSWTGGDLDKEGTHPIVYPGAGSHASYLGSNLYLGNGKSGFGCDDTRGPQKADAHPELLPTNPGLKGKDAWLTFEGLWGQKEPGFYKGPGGPSQHEQWREPFRWANGLRTDAPTVPAGTTFGPSATNVFCGAVTAGSKAVLFATESKWVALLIVLVLAGLAIWAAHSTTWHKRDPLPLGQRLAAGEVLRGANSLDRVHRWLY